MLVPLTTIDLKVGDSETLRLTVANDDDSKIDLSGFSAEFSVNRSRKGQVGDFTYLSTDGDGVVSVVLNASPALDEVVIVVTPAMTRAWSGGKEVTLQFEVTLTDTLGARRSILDGELDMRGEVRFEP